MILEHQLARSAPEAQGIASSAIHAFVDEVEQTINELHSFILLRHGQVVAEGWWAPYVRDYPHMLFSLSKSFASSAIGLAVAEGRLSLDAPVLSFFPDDAPAAPSENLAAMQVRHLLSMSTGNDEDTTGYLRNDEDGNWARAFLARPVEHPPGTHFVYNSGATYMLSAIIQRLTGMTLLEYLQPRLLAPLGIENATWESCPRGISTGGWGLNIKTEDIANFGQLYLQKGLWQGTRLLPEAWVAEATSKQVSNPDQPNIDWQQGYGYQFWLCRHGAYRGDGAFGQYCIVMPEQDAVLAITSGLGDMQEPLNLVWKHLLPAMGPAALPADATAQAGLRQKLASLSLRPVAGQTTSPIAARVSGRTYAGVNNASDLATVSFDFDEAAGSLTIRDSRGEHQVAFGNGVWWDGTTTLEARTPLPQAVPGRLKTRW